ncbi:MAG: hypothetical protein KKE12_07935, partial [Proteobacteria bacterium]|nr:hypothetical protein [Pseudomonadota bacterium]
AVDAIDKTTLRKFDIKSLSSVPNYTAKQISLIRHKLGLSQAVFAAYLVPDRKPSFLKNIRPFIQQSKAAFTKNTHSEYHS